MKRYTYEFIKEQFEKEGYQLISKEYKNAHIKLDYICNNGHKNSITYGNFQQGLRCSECSGTKILTYEFVKEQFKAAGYTLLSKTYVNNSTKLKFACPNNHEGFVTYGNFQQGNRCPICLGIKKLTYNYIKEQFEKEGYTLLSKEYINNHERLDYICSKGHKCSIIWSSFRQGHRCKLCYNLQLSKNLSFSYAHVQNLFNKRGYTLLSDKYEGAHSKLKYLCPNGHEGEICLSNFNIGQGCKKCSCKDRSGPSSHLWKGGVVELNLPLYNTFMHQISWIEKVRRDPDNYDLLQVKCTETNCRKWFTPTRTQVCQRIKALNRQDGEESNLYCSEECKANCSTFNQKDYPKWFKPDYSREVQAELRDMVLERDNYECQRCETHDDLQCHHIESIWYNPIESADMDICITLCKKCHKLAHTEIGCRYIDLTRKNICAVINK